jgi:hypothetical protein
MTRSGGSGSCREHGRTLLLESLNDLQLLNVLSAKDMIAEGVGERRVEQTAVLVSLGRTQRGLVDKLNRRRVLGTLFVNTKKERRFVS